MERRTILSKKLVQKQGIDKEMSLAQINDKAGLTTNYIYRILDDDRMQLSTLNQIALALDCSVCELLEEVPA